MPSRVRSRMRYWMASAMFGLDRVGAFEVGAGAATFRMRSWTLRPCWLRRVLAAFAINRERAGCADVAGGHLGVFFAGRGEAFELLLAGANDAVANLGRSFGICAPAAPSLPDTPRFSAHVGGAANRDARSQTFRFSCGNPDAHGGSSEWLVHSPGLASCTICV
jgi:hypothetical protein